MSHYLPSHNFKAPPLPAYCSIDNTIIIIAMYVFIDCLIHHQAVKLEIPVNTNLSDIDVTSRLLGNVPADRRQ